MSDQSRKRLVQRFFEAISAEDRATLAGILSEEARWVIPKSAPDPFGGTHQGNREIADLMVGVVSETFVPGTQTFDVLLMLEEEDVVIAEANVKARTLDGQDYDNFYVFIFEFEGDRVRELREHLDTIYAASFFAR